MNKRHIAQYGNVKVEREYCDTCKTTALIIDGRLQCCDKKIVATEEQELPIQSMSSPQYKRRKIRPAIKKLILEFQGNKCAYCGCKLRLDGSIQVHFDHVIPFSFSASQKHNIVATCSTCNLKKNNKMFGSLLETMIHTKEL